MNLETLLSDAASHLKAGRVDVAEALYQRALEHEPRNGDALCGLGVCRFKAGDLAAAEQNLSDSVAVSPDSASVHFHLAAIHHARMRHVDAIAEYDKSLALDATQAGVWRHRGDAHQYLSEHKKAVADYREAIRLLPVFAAAHHGLGVSLLHVEDFEGAEQAFRETLRLQPDHSPAQTNLANTLRGAGRLDEAREILKRCVQRGQNKAANLCYLGATCLEAGHPGEAFEALKESLDLNPYDRRQLAYMTAALQILGRKTEAAKVFDFDTLLRRYRSETPPAYVSADDFHRALASHVHNFPTLAWERPGNTTRGGDQTGNLMDGELGPVGQLISPIDDAIRKYLAELPQDPTHPYLAWKMDRWRLVAWGVILGSGGYQDSHVHPDAWLSGVYYVKVPEEISASEHAGWLEFGRPPERLGQATDPLVRLEKPVAGEIVLFPSYYYHRTIPFESDQQRISIAFDVQPKAEG